MYSRVCVRAQLRAHAGAETVISIANAIVAVVEIAGVVVPGFAFPSALGDPALMLPDARGNIWEECLRGSCFFR